MAERSVGQKIVLGLFLLSLLIIPAIQSGLIQLPTKICHYNEHTKTEECATYNPAFVLWIQVSKFFHDNESVFLVLLTLVIAGFTGTLWKATSGLKESTDKLWAAGEKQIAAAQTAANAAVAANNLNREMFVAENRPWISLDRNPEITGDLVFADDDAILDAIFTLKNTGKTPARNVHLVVELDPFCSPLDEMLKKQRHMTWEGIGQQSTGEVLFPGDRSPCEVNMSMPMDEIREAKQSGRGQSGDAFSIMPIIMVKIFYQSASKIAGSGETAIFETGYLFALREESDKLGWGRGIKPSRGRILQEQLLVFRYNAGNYAT